VEAAALGKEDSMKGDEMANKATAGEILAKAQAELHVATDMTQLMNHFLGGVGRKLKRAITESLDPSAALVEPFDDWLREKWILTAARLLQKFRGEYGAHPEDARNERDLQSAKKLLGFLVADSVLPTAMQRSSVGAVSVPSVAQETASAAHHSSVEPSTQPGLPSTALQAETLICPMLHAKLAAVTCLLEYLKKLTVHEFLSTKAHLNSLADKDKRTDQLHNYYGALDWLDDVVSSWLWCACPSPGNCRIPCSPDESGRPLPGREALSKMATDFAEWKKGGARTRSNPLDPLRQTQGATSMFELMTLCRRVHEFPRASEKHMSRSRIS
jgi:hypothetical protein